MYSWEVEKYKKERNSSQKKLKNAERELDSHKKMLQSITEMINKYCDDETLTFDDFMFYWDKLVESDEGIFAEQFGTMIMTAKIFFGEDLHKIRVGEEREAEAAHKAMLEDRARQKKRKKEYEDLLLERSIEREASIKKRRRLLDKIFVSHSAIDDLPDEDIPHAKALIESGHLKASYWLGRLKIQTREDIPPEHDKEYYECRNHPGCPYTGMFGTNFYSTMARMAGL